MLTATRSIRHPLVAYLALRGITVLDLAREVGVTREHLSRALSGHTPLTSGLRSLIAEALGVPAEDLFDEVPS